MNFEFTQKVLAIVRQIPAGKTLTYGQVAAMAGSPRSSRAVGTILSKNYNPEIPCHRVIRADGAMGGYNRGGIERKREILKNEQNRQNQLRGLSESSKIRSS